MIRFIQQYRKLSILTVLVLAVMLVIAVKHKFWIEPAIMSKNVDDSTTVQPKIENPPTGIVRTGFVGTPTLLPIYSGFAGRVSEIYVKEGQAVKAGQPLFKLEVSSVVAETAAEPAANQSKESANYQKLYEQGIISRREFENAAKRQRTTSTASSSSVVSHAPVTTTAPIEGIVTGLTATPEISVLADQRILSLGGGQTIEVVVPLKQQELYLVQLGTPAFIEVSGQTIMGEVSSIFPEVKGNEISSFLAHINLANLPAGLLQVGMSVTVRMDVGP